jgi:ubiquinone/menaquinone biosynthesis C-methylase UbiE
MFCKEFISKQLININNAKILDAGCGDGGYTDILTKNGGKVIECDGSVEMLKIAKEKYPEYKFDHVDITTDFPYADKQFDLVLCNLVLMDIDPISKTISEFYRVLRNGGELSLSIVHPAFYRAEWEQNEKSQCISKKVKSYITPTTEQQQFWGATTHYHRPISFYLNTATKSGFSLIEMLEPSVYESTKIPDIPLYLFLKFQKPHFTL